MIEVSVIIPTYRPGIYIWECLESLYTQTLDKDKFEVVIILNGCGDPWQGEILKWKEKHRDIHVKFITTMTPGVSNARNIGIDVANGNYITFLDDDDYVSASYLEGLLSQALKCKDAVVISNSVSFEDGSTDLDETYSLRKIYMNLKGNSHIKLFHARAIFNGPCMKLFPKSFIQGNYFDTSFKNSEDALYMFLVSKNFKEIVLAPEDCVYFRRFRKGSAVSKKKKNSEVIHNQLRFAMEIIKIYMRSPYNYDLKFTISRILASVKTIYLQLIK